MLLQCQFTSVHGATVEITTCRHFLAGSAAADGGTNAQFSPGEALVMHLYEVWGC